MEGFETRLWEERWRLIGGRVGRRMGGGVWKTHGLRGR